MANGGQPSPVIGQPASAGPKPAASTQSDAVQSKRDLNSWWKTFKRGNAKQEDKGIPISMLDLLCFPKLPLGDLVTMRVRLELAIK